MGIAPTLEEARTASHAACLKKILGGQENDVRILNGRQPVFEHWVQDDKTGFTVVSIYTQENKKRTFYERTKFTKRHASAN